MTKEIEYNPFGNTRSTYRTPEARARRRGSWVKAGVGLVIAITLGVGVGSWALVSSAEDKAQESVENAYVLGTIASSVPEEEAMAVIAALAITAEEENNPGEPIDQDKIRAEVTESVNDIMNPLPEITMGSSVSELREAFIPPVTLCSAALMFPPEQPDLSTLYTTCVDFQDAVFRMIQDVSGYNEMVKTLGPLSWGKDPVPELMDENGIHPMLDPAILGE